MHLKWLTVESNPVGDSQVNMVDLTFGKRTLVEGKVPMLFYAVK